MMKTEKNSGLIALLLCMLTVVVMTACTNDDDFVTSSINRVAFSADTIHFDTLFANVPSTTKSVWVYNHSNENIRFQNVSTGRAPQTGFRVNVDGIYLGTKNNYQSSDIELRKGDSLKVFVELTAPKASSDSPTLTEDDLIFTLGDGAEQKIHLNAYTWNALMVRNMVVSHDSTINSQGRPLVIYGGIKVDSTATLKIAAGQTLYFHGDAQLDVYGTLIAQGNDHQPITLRGDRLDRMFDYLPYDRVPGQWKGIHIHTSSYGNQLVYTDIHNAFDGVVVDSSDVNKQKLTASQITIHNCQGAGLKTTNSNIILNNAQITNTLGDCVEVDGGAVEINNNTLAQFYPFDGNRGYALHFSANHPLAKLNVTNSLITGYADDLISGERPKDQDQPFHFNFEDCVLRTPKPTTADSVFFKNIIYEDVKDTTKYGEKNFVKIDADKQYYDFHLSKTSAAVDKANAKTALPIDRDRVKRDELPDIGAYEYRKEGSK